ncbi:transcription termination factor Rho [Alloscardovia theropitheci]|uniref:Transcription termination factor Rho n=1 Tax=Alloscardovia theropitheci TaxID=2496842 RepID=A0A4R0QX14_9BIFI|nr:transcription termination factor Rho [Alloscardovia theropitheci]TCD53901.1 transcription termination factor Rho [Alloscardovia theropitheci]
MANTNLADMKLPELRELAKQMMLRGTSTMRKPELIDVIERARSGGEAPAGVRVVAPKANKTTATRRNAKNLNEDAHNEETAQSASSVQLDVQSESDSVESAQSSQSEQSSLPILDLPLPRGNRSRRASAAQDDSNNEENTSKAKITLDLGDIPVRRRRNSPVSAEEQAAHEAQRHQVKADLDDILSALPDRSERERAENIAQSAAEREQRGTSAVVDRRNRLSNEERQRLDEETENTERRMRRNTRVDVMDDDSDDDFDERSSRSASSRNRMRNDRNDRNARKNRNDVNDDQQIDEPNDELIPVAGVIDILDSYAFVRTSGYLPGPNDVYVSMGQVKKYGLRKGDAVRGYIKAARDDRRSQRQKFVPLQSIETINGLELDEAAQRPQFSKLTPLYPQERLKMETNPNNMVGRIIDIVSPIGKGQRGLIVSPPKAGKTITLQNIANSITANNPEVHLMVVLVDERPEEVTDMERTVQGEIIASTFDRPATDHTIVAELAIERAKRLVELGQDVVVLLDSMTRLARAYNIAAPASGRILSGGVDAQALYPPKKFFGAARNIENGGSLTIISSALVETGSKMDEVIFEEFKGTGNMELRLSRDLSEKRLFPAIDINASSTRREELITDPSQMPIIYRLRRALGGLEPEASYQQLVGRLKKTQTNAEFFRMMAQGN